jgi:hypothetical protein
VREGGLGLGILRRRAEKLHGSITAETPQTGGTSLIWQVPILIRPWVTDRSRDVTFGSTGCDAGAEIMT